MISLIRRYPVTVAYFVLILVASIITGVLTGPSPAVRNAVGTGFEQLVHSRRWWTPITSGFFTTGGSTLVITLVAIVLGIGLAERLMGSTRTVVATLGSATIGTLVGVGLQSLGVAGGELWASAVSGLNVVDPFTFVVGSVMAASAFSRPLWRRRIRVLLLSACMVFLLYSGQPSDVYQMLAALAGLLIGIAYRPNRPHAEWFRSSHHEARLLLSVIVAMTALGPVITLATGRRFGLLGPLGLLMSDSAPLEPGAIAQCQMNPGAQDCLRDFTLARLDSFGPILLAVMPLLTLLVVAVGLLRGRRLAAWLGIVLNLALVALGSWYYGVLPVFDRAQIMTFHTPHDWEVSLTIAASIVVPLVVAVLLVRNLSHFTIRAREGQVRAYARAMGVALAALSALYLGGGWLERMHFHPVVGFMDLLADLPERFIPIGYLHIEVLAFVPTDTVSRLLYYWVGPAFWAVVILGALSTYFDSGSRNYSEGLPRVRELRWAGGGGRLGAWATWEGNSFWFSADNRATVAYRVLNGVAITTSEPIGDPEAAQAAIPEFSRFCDDRGWIPVFYAIHDSFLPAIRRMGWRSVVVGEETIIRPDQWQTTGKVWQDVRTAISRAERQGIRAEWTTFDELTGAQASQVRDISEQWVSSKRLPEMGFTLGGMAELRDPEVGLMIAVDDAGKILGVTSWMPAYRDGAVIGWTLDFMRRAPDAMNGVMEFLIARTAEHFREQGTQYMSLSTAPLARSAAGGSVGVTSRALAVVGNVLEPVYGFRSLFQFKKKFQPELHPILMAYPDALSLPRIGIALARAYLPGLSLRQSIRFLTRRD